MPVSPFARNSGERWDAIGERISSMPEPNPLAGAARAMAAAATSTDKGATMKAASADGVRCVNFAIVSKRMCSHRAAVVLAANTRHANTDISAATLQCGQRS